MGEGGTTGQSIRRHGWFCFGPDLCYLPTYWVILSIEHCLLDPSSPCSTISQLSYLSKLSIMKSISFIKHSRDQMVFLIWQLDINSEIKIGHMSMPTVDY